MAAPNLVKLPMALKLKDGVKLIADKFNMARFDEANQMFLDAHHKGLGFPAEEVTEEAMRARLSNKHAYYIRKEDNDDIVSIFTIHPSPVSRSNQPMTHAGLVLVHPDFQGKSLGSGQYYIMISRAIESGYLGGNSRIAINSRNLFAARSVGGVFVGSIPYSTPLKGVGAVDDIITYISYDIDKKYPEFYKELMAQRAGPLKPLQRLDDIPSKILSQRDFEPMEVKTSSGRICIRPCKGAEIWTCEEQWRTAAEEGLGFGLDEFNDQGHFNRKFFGETYVAVAEDNQGELVGSALFGPSAMSRADFVAQNYIFAGQKHRRIGLGGLLLDYSMRNITDMGFKGAISDNYITNMGMLHLLHKRGYYFIGSLPKCGYVKDVGPSDSLLVYLPISK